MNKDLRIEYYLHQLDRSLQTLPVSQRAEIITEIKSHIYGSLEKDGDIEQVLAKLGSAASVAERYLAMKGILTPAPASRPWQILKWIGVATVAFFAVIFFSGIATVWYLSPLIQVDEHKGRVTLFNGLIDVNEKIGRVRVGGIEVNDAFKEGIHVSGEQDLTDGKITMVRVPFNTAKLNINSSVDQVMRWECKATGSASPKAAVDAGIMTLNLDSLNLAKCSISLPQGTATEFRGVNGQMDVKSPSDAIDIELTNGKVDIHPDVSRVYDFEVKVKNGMQDSFPHSSAKNAVKIKVNVVNGLVKQQ